MSSEFETGTGRRPSPQVAIEAARANGSFRRAERKKKASSSSATAKPAFPPRRVPPSSRLSPIRPSAPTGFASSRPISLRSVPSPARPISPQIAIEYQPRTRCLETKSLKFYLASYRNERAFNEARDQPHSRRSREGLPAAADDRQSRVRRARRNRPHHHGQLPRRPEDAAMKRAVVLLSGGLDSATVLAICRAEGFEAHALSFRYGQRHEREFAAAEKVAHSLGADEHRIAEIDLRLFGGSALTDEIAVPKARSEAEMATGIPAPTCRRAIRSSFPTLWPRPRRSARPTSFFGANAVDYSGYPDCRPEFIQRL